MRYMLDTNISIYIMKRHPAEVLSRFDSLRQGDVVMSVVTHAELRAGLEMQTVNRSSDEHVLGLLISRIPVLPFDDAAAVSYGVLRAALRERNRNALDRLIGAHALSTGATLVTNNEADFKDYPGLVIENWVNSAQAPR